MSEITTLSFIDQMQWVKERVDKTLLNQFQRFSCYHEKLITVMKHSVLFGGKKIRPFLIYAVGHMLKVSVENLDIPAAAIECIHAYSLIHDDLPAMDNDIIRRGKPTCHISFGESYAILAGDALHTLAFEILSNSIMPDVHHTDRLAMISELATSIGVAGMCGGQALDIEFNNKKIDISTLKIIHLYKTAALIIAAIRIGVFTAGSKGHKLLPYLNKYASIIGLLFQIHDDILDIIDDTENLNKNNKVNYKNTYPSLIGLENSKKKERNLYKQAVNILCALEYTYGVNTKILQNITYFIFKHKTNI